MTEKTAGAIPTAKISILTLKKAKNLFETAKTQTISKSPPEFPKEDDVYLYYFSVSLNISSSSFYKIWGRDGHHWKCRGTKTIEKNEGCIIQRRYYYSSDKLNRQVLSLTNSSQTLILVHYQQKHKSKPNATKKDECKYSNPSFTQETVDSSDEFQIPEEKKFLLKSSFNHFKETIQRPKPRRKSSSEDTILPVLKKRNNQKKLSEGKSYEKVLTKPLSNEEI